MTWYKDFGFEYNPLTIKPVEEFELFFDGKSVVEDIISVMDSGKNLILIGPLGTGKTSVLKKIRDEFGGKRKLFYYNAFSASTSLDFERVLRRAGNFFSRTLGVKSKDVILFVDEAHHLSSENLEDLEDYLDDYKSVVLASSELSFDVPSVLKEHFNDKINLGRFTESDAENIIKDRLGEDDFEEIISVNEIKDVFEKSNTPRDFLLRCEIVCRNKHEN